MKSEECVMKKLISTALLCVMGVMPATVVMAEDVGVRYEYKVIDLDRFMAPEVYQETLNAAGREGWELVGNERITFNGMNTVIRFFMKREVGERAVSEAPAYKSTPPVRYTSNQTPAMNSQMHELAQQMLRSMMEAQG
jgi:hypothetical protein